MAWRDAIKTVPIVAVTPDQKEVKVTTVIQTTPPVAAAVTPTPAPVAGDGLHGRLFVFSYQNILAETVR